MPRLRPLSRIVFGLAVIAGLTAAHDGFANDLAGLNNEFDSVGIDGWSNLATVEKWADATLKAELSTSEPGTLHLEPNTSIWGLDIEKCVRFQTLNNVNRKHNKF